jgi:hypothetical protein
MQYTESYRCRACHKLDSSSLACTCRRGSNSRVRTSSTADALVGQLCLDSYDVPDKHCQEEACLEADVHVC